MTSIVQPSPVITAAAANDPGQSDHPDAPPSLENPYPQKRLSDQIAVACLRARDAGYGVVAEHLRNALDSLLALEAARYPHDRRTSLDTVTRLRNELVVRLPPRTCP